MRTFKPSRGISDVSDFNEVASEIFESFLESFKGNEELLRPVTEQDDMEELWLFIYTSRGTRLADTMRRRLQAIGEAHFPDDELWIEIESNLYQEY